jgi:hypothetical protein
MENKEKNTNVHCKYNEKTERCIINPDPSALQNDPKCYKTDKNRCASNMKDKKK